MHLREMAGVHVQWGACPLPRVMSDSKFGGGFFLLLFLFVMGRARGCLVWRS